MTLIGMKIHGLQQIEGQDALFEFGRQVQMIVNCIKDSSIRKEVLAEIIKDLKESFDVDVERYV